MAMSEEVKASIVIAASNLAVAIWEYQIGKNPDVESKLSLIEMWKSLAESTVKELPLALQRNA